MHRFLLLPPLIQHYYSMSQHSVCYSPKLGCTSQLAVSFRHPGNYQCVQGKGCPSSFPQGVGHICFNLFYLKRIAFQSGDGGAGL